MMSLAVGVVGPLLGVAMVIEARRAEVRARARSLTGNGGRRLPRRVRCRVERALADADIAVAPETAIELWVIGMCGSALVTAALVPGLLVPALLAVGAGGPVGLRFARARHEQRFVAGLPGVLEQVAAELRGGGSVAGAVERLASSDGVVARDFRRVHVRTRLGLGLTDALAAWPIEHDAVGVRAAAGALAVAASLGGRAADAIDGLASSLRHRLDALAEARALSAQARMSAVVVGAAPIGYLVFASVVDARSVGALFNTGVGRVCLVVGLALEGLAAVWIRRIVRSEA